MAHWYYYNAGGEKVGPITPAALKSLAMQGVIAPTTVIENGNGRSTEAGKVNGLSFPAMSTPPATTSLPLEETSFAAPVGLNPFSLPMSTPDNSFGNSTARPPFVQPAETCELTADDVRPISTELLGMKPEVLFTFMYIAAIFSFSIITFFIPIVIWALTKEKDKRADLHGSYLLAMMIGVEVFNVLCIVSLLCEVTFFALCFSVGFFVFFVTLIVAAFYAGYGYVPVGRKSIWPGIKHGWVLLPTPTSPLQQAVSSQPLSPTASPVEEIKKMKELLDCGAITQEEFNAFKKKALGI